MQQLKQDLFEHQYPNEKYSHLILLPQIRNKNDLVTYSYKDPNTHITYFFIWNTKTNSWTKHNHSVYPEDRISQLLIGNAVYVSPK